MRSKKNILFLLVCTMLFINSISVMAAEPQKGSIEIILTDGDIGTSKENVVFEYAKVADVVDGQYKLLEEYENVDLNTIKYSAELDEAAQKLNEKVKAEGKTSTDQEGKATISNLEVGVYLLRVSDKARYENVQPFLISIPTWNEEQGDMNFDVTVIPKHTPNEPGTITTETPDNKEEGSSSKGNIPTGDNLRIMFWMAILATSLVTTITVYNKRRENYEK